MPESARKLNSKVDINLSEFQSVKRDFAFVVPDKNEFKLVFKFWKKSSQRKVRY